MAGATSKTNPHLVAYPSILNILPEPFERPNFLTNLFYQTTLPGNAPPEFGAAYERLHNASFISFDLRFATDVIGSAGPVEKVAVIEDGSQEMPMYLKDEGVIFWNGNDLAQLRTINVKTYEVKNNTTSVPVPNAAAGTIHNGQIYLGNFGSGYNHYGGIWLLDYKSSNATMILNNQLVLSIGADDMTADDRGGIFFTDTSARVVRTNRTMQSPPSVYYLRLGTMSLIAVDPTLMAPNGVVLSPDGLTLSNIQQSYVNDEGDIYDPPNNVMAQVLTASKLDSTVYINSAGPRTMYVFLRPSILSISAHTENLSYAYPLSPTTGLPTGRRTLAVAEAGILDGMKVSSSGHIFAAVFGGVDVYHPDGTRLGKINIPEASPNGKAEERHVVNLVFEGNNLWCFADGGVYRIPGLLVMGDPRLG
ncbi:hypothetical protein B0H19DRAFT_1069161 [Mycena capillaripes]|nr:hypothetical protein B0H19DRAFT_1069161 [Mycena capillaripes]